MKFLKYIALSSVFVSSLAFAQHRAPIPSQDAVENVAQKVEKLVERHGEMLPPYELDRIYRNLNSIVRTFNYYGLDLADDIPLRVCNGSNMVELDGTLIHSFTFRSGCQNALDRANEGKPFCSQSLMVDAYGNHIHNFTFNSGCTGALDYVSEGKYFCDGNVLYNSRGERQQSFTFNSECQRVRDQINAN